MARLLVRREPRGVDQGLPSGAVLGSMGIHTIVLMLAIWGAGRIVIPPPPQIYQVELLASPRKAPVRTVPVPEKPPPVPERETTARPVETKPAPEAAPRREARPAKVEEDEEEASQEPKVEERPAAPPEPAEEGAEDLPVRLEGARFPYPEYLANIILQIKRHWRPPVGGRQLRSEVAFTILRDGSVVEVSWVRRSGSPAFDLEARGAIETAGRRRAFGPLPDDFPADRLRVSFFFDPTRY